MVRVAHINDDPKLGGVTRWLDVILRQLDPAFVHDIQVRAPKSEVPPRLNADIIVLHFPPSWATLPWREGLRRRNPQARIIQVEHSYTRGFEALHVSEMTRFRLLLRLAYRQVDRVVAVSAGQRDWLLEVSGLAPRRVVLIHPFTDLSALRRLPPPVRQPGPLRLCGYGRFSAQKGFDYLIDAMKLVSPEVATLRLVGLGEEEAALRAQAAGLPHVRIEGPVPGPENLFGEIDAVAMPSRFEAFGIVAAETRAAARPLIAALVDGLPGHVLPGVPQLTMLPGDVKRLATCITWLAGQDVTALGEAARASLGRAEHEAVETWNTLLHGLAPALAEG